MAPSTRTRTARPGSRTTDADAWARLPPLRDCIRPGVRLLLVGINPGIRSAEIGHHFAGYSNRFWKLLYESGLVSERIATEDDWRLPEWGYGITNLVARATPGIGDLESREYQTGRRRLVAKIRRYRPAVVALVGVTLYRALFGRARGGRREAAGTRSPRGVGRKAGGGKRVVDRARDESGRRSSASRQASLGLRPERLAGADVFVLPNPSGRNANFSYAEMLDAFRALRQHLDWRPRPRA